jgi:hypothetical protein
MKFKQIDLICIVLSLLAFPALAAIDDGNTSMIPTLSQAWAGLTPFLKEKITWIIGISFIALVVVGVLYSLLSGGHTLLSGARGDVAGRSSGISNMILGVAVIFAALLAISIIFFLVN